MLPRDTSATQIAAKHVYHTVKHKSHTKHATIVFNHFGIASVLFRYDTETIPKHYRNSLCIIRANARRNNQNDAVIEFHFENTLAREALTVFRLGWHRLSVPNNPGAKKWIKEPIFLFKKVDKSIFNQSFQGL